MHGARTNSNIDDAHYSEDLVDVLRKQGYRIGLSGKNHSHVHHDRWDWASEFGHDHAHQKGQTEDEVKFDEWIKGLQHMASHEPTPFPLECQYPSRIVDQAQKWIGQPSEDPFFLWMSFPEPHNPYQVPEPYYSMFPSESLPNNESDETALKNKGERWLWLREQWKKTSEDFPAERERTRSNYHGMLRLIDDQVKRFVESLERSGKMDNTILVFTSDHGDFVGEYGLIRKGPDLPECLARIPFFVVGPGVTPGVRDSAHVNLCDIMPTLCNAAGAKVPYGTQGLSLWPVLGETTCHENFTSTYAEHGLGGNRFTTEEVEEMKDPNAPPLQCTFDCLNNMTQSGASRMVRKGRWKLIADETGRQQLFDLQADPLELHDRIHDVGLRETLLDLQSELINWMIRLQDPLPEPKGKYRYKALS